MQEIEVEGTFYGTRGWSKRPVIYVDPPHDVSLNDWRNQNKLYTQWLERPHPRTAKTVPVLYPSPTFAARFNDGDSVMVKLAVRPDSRGNGMKFVDALPRSGRPLKRNEPKQPARQAAPVRRSVGERTVRMSGAVRRTPRLPKFIREFRPANCPHQHPWCLAAKNVYELPGLENERKPFGTERMIYSDGSEVNGWTFGDWDSDMLLLMQDAAPVDGIAERIGKHPDPFSARNFIEEPRGKGANTNRNLYNLASTIDCRKLVGSALVGVLKPGSDYSSRIANCQYVRDYCLRALAWVLNNKQTPNLTSVACLGEKASQFLSDLLYHLENKHGCISPSRLCKRSRNGSL